LSSNPLAHLRDTRLQKAASLRELGLNPYPAKSSRTHFAAAITSNYGDHEGKAVTVAGRLMSWRKQGALAFGHIQDQSGSIQLMFRRDSYTGEGALPFEHLNLVDVGDIVECTGLIGKTQREEISVMATSFRILTKSLRPLPDKYHGIQDREIALRKRYLDTTVSPEKRETFTAIGRMLFEIRKFLYSRGFLEFVTPVIQPQYGGGTAEPFVTHLNALSRDMYLAISHELYLKRLVVAGFDKVFTIGRYFRNEGIDRSHHPEFSMIETMTAYENYEYNMQLIEDLFRHIAVEVFRRTKFMVKGHEVDFANAWPRHRMSDIVQSATGIDFTTISSVEEANEKLRAMGVNEPAPTVGHAMVLAFEEKVEKTLIQPAFVYGHPIEISPLAKPMAEDPRYVERFEIFIAGMECGDNWSEQNDPVALLSTWKKARETAAADATELHPLDYDFIEAMEHGMPPTTGIGPGIERMVMIFTGQEDIYDVIFFPLMKPQLTPVNRAIFGVSKNDQPEQSIDLTISQSDMESMLEKKLLKAGPKVSITPVMNYFANRVIGHWELEGLSNGGKIHLSGWQAFGENLEERFLAATHEWAGAKLPGVTIHMRPTVVNKPE
jgi:lysyl-tRNA synthetase, class II